MKLINIIKQPIINNFFSILNEIVWLVFEKMVKTQKIVTNDSLMPGDLRPSLLIKQTKRIINEKENNIILSIPSIWRFTVYILYKKIAFWLRILKFKRNCMKRFNFFSPGANQLEMAKSIIFYLIINLFNSIEMSYLCVIFIYLLYQIIIIRKF